MNMHSLENARQTIGYMESSGANLSQSLKRLSSGIKVDANDAGGLAVSTKMDSVITRTRTLGANVQNGMSFLESQDAAQSKLGAILTRMSELRVRYDDPTINTSDGANLNREFKELQDDVRALARKKFNGISLFSSGSHADSKLVIGANSANPSNVREVTRNQFFNSLLDTQSSGGPVGGSATRQINFGSFTDLSITPTGGTASVPGNKVNGLQGSTTVKTLTPTGGTVADFTAKGLQGTTSGPITINGIRGTTPPQTVNGVATGTTTDLTINGEQGTFSTTVNGAQGTTPDFTISGTAGSGAGATASVTTTGGTSPTTNWKTGVAGVPALPAGGTNGFDKMSPVFDSNGDIFIGKHEDDKIFQLDASDGSLVRTYDLGAGNKNMSWKVAVADTSGDGSTDTLYAANGDGKQLIAFDTSNGNVKTGWPQNLGGAGDAWAITEAPPFVHSNGNVYVMSNGAAGFGASGKVYSFQSDGTPLPGFTPLDVNGEFSGGFAEAADGTLIVTGKGTGVFHRSVQAFHPDTGASLWTADRGSGGGRLGEVEGPPVIVGNSVVVNTGNRTDTAAFDIATGTKTVWRNNSGRPDGGVVIGKSNGTDAVFAATSNGVAAIAFGGGTLWIAGGDYETCTPAYDPTKNRVYFTDDNTGEVVALRTATEGGNAAGSEAWRIATGSASFSSPAVDSSGNIYVGNNNGDFIAISPPGITLPDLNIGTGYTVAPPITDITLTQTSALPDVTGTLAVASVALNDGTLGPAGSLRVTFTGAATGAGIFDVTVAGSTINTPVPVGPVGSGYLTTETAPAARVLAEGIGDKAASLKTGLVTLIDGDTGSPAGGGTITDSSGSGNDGTVAAGQEPAHEVTDRKSGIGAYTFDGTDDKINLGTLNADIGGQDKLTISAWVSHNGSGDHRIVCKSPNTTPGDHIFSLGIANDDILRMRIGTDTTNAINMSGTTAIPNDGTWTHVAMTYDGANVKSYVNGKLDSSQALTGNIKTSADNVFIGNVNNANNRHFQGKLDDVGIWNRTLTDSEIAEIAGPGDLTATTAINDGTDPLKPAGTLTVTPAGTLATIGPFTVEVDDGVMRNPADFTTGIATTSQLYDAPSDTVGSTKNVTFSGTDANNLAATATVRADGQLDIKFTTGAPSGTGNLTLTVDGGAFHLDDPPPQGSSYASGETPAFTITGADSGTTGLAGTATVITTGPDAGKLNVDLSTVQPTGTGNLTLKIADGFKAPADLTGIGSGYVFGPPAETPTVTVTGADRGTLITGTATVQSDGKLNVTFPTDKFPTGSGNLTVTVAPGVVQNPANIPSIGTGYDATETPAFTITDGDVTDTTPLPATTTGNATNNGDGTLSVDLSGIVPTGTGDLILTVNSGTVRAPANLTGIGSGYTSGDTPPTVNIIGANKDNLTATATINGSGSLDITFAGSPLDTNDVTIQIDDGVGRLTNQAGLGSGYAAGDNPTFTVSGGGTNMTGNATVNDGITGGPPPPAAGTLNVDLSAVRTDDLTDRTITIAAGSVQAPADLTGIGSGYTLGDTPPTVNITGANKDNLTATATINGSGSLDITFAGSPLDTNDVTIQIDDGVGHLANQAGGSGYAATDNPAFTISGGGTNMTGFATPDGSGGLTVNLSNARPDDFTARTLQIANGTTLQTPADVTGIGAFHDPSGPPPTVILSGADAGLTATATVQSDGKVNVSFAGTPTTAGTLNVQVLGASGTGSTAVSSKYLLDIDGDLWDYTVSEFESFTELVSDARAQNGAEQNSLSTFWELLSTNVNKLEQAAGRIKDADFAKEMTEISKSQINSRSAAVMLGKQNRLTSEALLTLQNLSNMM